MQYTATNVLTQVKLKFQVLTAGCCQTVFNPLVFRGVDLGVILPPGRYLVMPGDIFCCHNQEQRRGAIGISRTAAGDASKHSARSGQSFTTKNYPA